MSDVAAEYQAFFDRNKEGITHFKSEPRTYYMLRSWVLRGPIPRGVRIEHVGLANNRRVGKVKRTKE
jgi:hypothetical protein